MLCCDYFSNKTIVDLNEVKRCAQIDVIANYINQNKHLQN